MDEVASKTTRLFQTTALRIVDMPADGAHFGGRRVWPPRFVIVHATGGTNSLQWLRSSSPASNPVSVHRLIAKDGTIFKIVADDETAWHAGYGELGPIRPGGAANLNAFALGIELENLNSGYDPYPATQVQACAAQIVEWWGMYGFLPVLSHAAVDPRKDDPQGFDWPTLWRAMWRELG
ncbi:MAG: hypothetical protein NVS4B8_30550 [Herpetosiphon sp.]